MSLVSFAKQTIIVVTAGTKTVHGNATDDWKNPSLLDPIDECSVQPVQGSESQDSRDATLVQWIVLAPPTAVDRVTAKNHIRFGGLEFQIVGAPQPQIYGLTTDHVQILMNVWEG